MKSKKILSEKIIKIIKKRGFQNIELKPIIETKHILRSSGESFRKLIFSFYDQSGNEFSLRPDLSLSSLIQFMMNKNNNRKKICYSGEAYRKIYLNDKGIIKNQIGLEIYNSFNQTKDDKEIVSNCIKVYRKISDKKGDLLINNINIFNMLIQKLNIPSRWKKRLTKHFWRQKYFGSILKRLQNNKDIDDSSLEIDKKSFNKIKKIKRNFSIAGRSINEILDRFEMKIKDPRNSKGKKSVKIINDYLKITCPINRAPEKLNSFFLKNKINLKISKNYFPISRNKIGKLNVKFSPTEIPEVDYYNGLIFFIKIKRNRKLFNLISGGRYDNLSVYLGFKKIPAVGAAINLNLI